MDEDLTVRPNPKPLPTKNSVKTSQTKVNKKNKLPICSSTIIEEDVISENQHLICFATVVEEEVVFEEASDLEQIQEIATAMPSTECIMYDFGSAETETLELFQNAFSAWEVLGFVDANLTKQFIDNVFVKSHKLCEHENYSEFLKESQHENLHKIVYKSYVDAMDYVAFVPTPSYGNDSTFFTQLAVVAVLDIPRKVVICGLKGFTAKIRQEDIKSGMEFSMLSRSSNQKDERIMLGPASFLNHSCNPNSR